MDAVYILFTTVEETLAAARVANALATAMAASLVLVVLRRMSLDAPAGLSSLDIEAFTGRLQAEGINARPRVYVSHDEGHAMSMLFKRPSLIVMAGRHHWWPTRADRWRRTLEAAGHFVVFVQSDVCGADRRETANA